MYMCKTKYMSNQAFHERVFWMQDILSIGAVTSCKWDGTIQWYCTYTIDSLRDKSNHFLISIADEKSYVLWTPKKIDLIAYYSTNIADVLLIPWLHSVTFNTLITLSFSFFRKTECGYACSRRFAVPCHHLDSTTVDLSACFSSKPGPTYSVPIVLSVRHFSSHWRDSLLYVAKPLAFERCDDFPGDGRLDILQYI